MDQAFYRSVAYEMHSKLRRLTSFVRHAPTIGAFHEEVLTGVLRTMLPDRYSLRTGFVYDKAFGASAQADILIVDESRAGAYHYREGNFAVVAHRAVVCVIEVKTALNKATFLQGISNLATFHRRARPFHDPATFLFAFESKPFSRPVLHNWYSSVTVADELINYPWAVFSLDRGILHLWKGANDRFCHHPIIGEADEGPKLKSLAFLLQQVRKALLLHDRDPANPFDDEVTGDLMVARQGLVFGRGIVDASASDGAGAAQ